ncbi:CAMK family protein kinase [Tritrichomonas foetus]|uniref:CAMK family protein kinase n=1 Tax=Tritrichomonas foetus TaxID=1144522 RepID=A0A1J4JIN3_9EUKA|nr:CAMK family protein kinase [Tritrichomonas foetus]|eukprot:OHS99010.1 CAMK family protein kinase [Tritrichomonas foetus]
MKSMIQGRFKVIEELSKGSTSNCYLCEDTSECRKVVLKIIPRDKYSEENFTNEVKLLDICKDPAVISVYDTITSKEEFIIVMEPGTHDLLNYIQENGPLTEKTTRYYFYSLIQALKVMHSHHIVHNDVKLENLVVTKDDKIKLIDFGLSEKLEINGKSKMFRGTFHYLAPEVMMFKPHDTKSDIWSLGVSLFAALTNEFPFDGDNQYEYSMNALQKPPKTELLEKKRVSESLVSMIQKMLEKDPEKRISIEDCCKFNWL